MTLPRGTPLVGVACVALLACGGASKPAADPAAAHASPTASSAVAHAAKDAPEPTLVPQAHVADVGGACTVGDPVDVGESTFGDIAPFGVAIAANSAGALAAWITEDEAVVARPLALDGTPAGPPQRARAPRTRSLVLVAQPDGTFVLLMRAPCPSGKATTDCASARTFTARGVPLEPVAVGDFGERTWMMTTDVVEGSRGALLSARPIFTYPSTTTARVLRVVPHDGAAATFEAIDPPAVFANRGDSFVRLEARHDGKFVLFGDTPDGKHVVQQEGAPPAILGGRGWRAIGDDDAAYIVYGESFDAAKRAVRIGPEGTTTDVPPAEAKSHGDYDVVDPLADTAVSEEASGLVLSRLVSSVHLPDVAVWDRKDTDVRGVPRAVTWTGKRFLVLYGRHEARRWHLRAAPVTCAAKR